MTKSLDEIGSTVRVPRDLDAPTKSDRRQGGSIYARLLRVVHTPTGLLGAIIVLVIVVMALAAPIIAPYNPLRIFSGSELVGPSGKFLLGTDPIGRDILSRLIFGSRPALEVGILAVLIGGFGGVVFGLITGYRGGVIDAIFGRFWDALFGLPAVLLAIALAAVLGPSDRTVAIAVGIATMPTFARLARASAIREREQEYVVACVAMGAKDRSIVFRHILPNSVGPLLVQAAYSMSLAVVMQAALSYLGLGSRPPAASWGSMMANSQQYLSQAPLYGIMPGVILTMLVIGLNLLADGIRNAFDARSDSR